LRQRAIGYALLIFTQSIKRDGIGVVRGAYAPQTTPIFHFGCENRMAMGLPYIVTTLETPAGDKILLVNNQISF
jgi:hypothetical protein